MPRPILYSTEKSPPCRAVLLTAKAIGLNLEIREINLMEKEQLEEHFLKINPQHTIPTLNDNGFILWDSHAIIRYLVDKYAKTDALYPKDLEKRAIIDQRLHFEADMIFAGFRNIVRSVVFLGKPLSADAVSELEESCAILNQLLEGKKWLVGNSYTIADISCVSSVATIPLMIPMANYPNIVAWLRKCEEELPDYAKTNGPGLQAINEMIKPIFSKGRKLVYIELVRQPNIEIMLRPIIYGTVWSPPSCAVCMTAKAIGLELDIREMNLLKGEHLTDDFRKLNPQRTVPTLNDNGFILCDSFAIMTYLVGKYSKSDALYPKDLHKRALVDQRLHFNSGHLSVRLKDAAKPILTGQSKSVSKESKRLVHEACDILNEFLSKQKWLAGETYTLADISCCSYINNYKILFPTDNYPSVMKWMENCQEQLPGFEEILTSGIKQLHVTINHNLNK